MPYRFLYLVCLWIASAAVLGWFAWFWTWQVAPHAPDAIHTVPENNHGTIIYFAPFQALWGPACWVVGAGAAIVGHILKKRDDPFPKSKFFR